MYLFIKIYIQKIIVLIFFRANELRRSLKSLIYSLKQIVQLFVFFILMTFFWAGLGLKFIGDLDGEAEYDIYSSNFNNFFKAFNILYALISFDGYPDCMIPAIGTIYIY